MHSDIVTALPLGHRDIILPLQADPELRITSEIAAQSQGCTRTDRASAIQEIAHAA